MNTRATTHGMRGTLFRWRGPLVLAATVALIGDLLLRLSGDPATAHASMLDVVLVITPLVGLVLGTTRLHQSRDVVELMLAQPVSRRRVFAHLWRQGALPLASALAVGVVAPFVWLRIGGITMPLALAGAAVVLALISHSLAMIIALRTDNAVRALGIALVTWLVAAVVWDGLVLVAALLFTDRPIELPVFVLLILNPVDLVRVLMLLGSDAAAMLGYTGAVVSRSLGTVPGRAALGLLLAGWLLLPFWWAARTFERKDF